MQCKLAPCTLAFMEGLPEEVMHKLHKSPALGVAVALDQQEGEDRARASWARRIRGRKRLFPEGFMGHAEC